MICRRRPDAGGAVQVLGHAWSVDSQWVHRLVRIEEGLTAQQAILHPLRRRDPTWQPLMHPEAYRDSTRRFVE